MADGSPFHVAANPRDSVRSLAGRYRAAFGNCAQEIATEDRDTAIRLDLPIRRALIDSAMLMLKYEDRRLRKQARASL